MLLSLLIPGLGILQKLPIIILIQKLASFIVHQLFCMRLLYIWNNVILPHFHHSLVGFRSLLMHFIEEIIKVAMLFGSISVVVDIAWCSSVDRLTWLINTPWCLLLLLRLLNLKQKVLICLYILEIDGVVLWNLRIWDFSSLFMGIGTHKFLAAWRNCRGAVFWRRFVCWFC